MYWGSPKSALGWLNSKYTETLHLNTQASDGHFQKLIKEGAHPGH